MGVLPIPFFVDNPMPYVSQSHAHYFPFSHFFVCGCVLFVSIVKLSPGWRRDNFACNTKSHFYYFIVSKIINVEVLKHSKIVFKSIKSRTNNIISIEYQQSLWVNIYVHLIIGIWLFLKNRKILDDKLDCSERALKIKLDLLVSLRLNKFSYNTNTSDLITCIQIKTNTSWDVQTSILC